MLINDEKSYVARWKLLRQAARAVAVLNRHADKSATLQTFKSSLEPCATKFIALDGSLVAATQADGRQLAEAEQAMDQLRVKVRNWVGLMARDIQRFDGSEFTDRLAVPDDVLTAARQLVHFVESGETGSEPLAYAAELAADLSEATDHAEQKQQQAQATMTRVQELRAESRKLGLELQGHLVAFRRVLRNVLGPSHRDYQRLRTELVSHGDDEEAILEAIASDPEATSNPSPSESATSSEEVAAE